jgi:N-carbamoyl-L-amino-acid hydrolase
MAAWKTPKKYPKKLPEEINMNAAVDVLQSTHQHINRDRLWASLMELAKLGATVKGGVCRLALTDLDRQARDLFVQWCKDAGCSVTVDEVGNIFARRPGRNPNLPPVMTGSHIDTQPTGGKFDGCFGVLAGVEVLRTLNDLGVETEAPLEVVVWTNEEGSRFAPCMMGSGVFAEKFTLEETLAKVDADGVTVGEALNAIGYAGSRKVSGHKVGAYFEAHIEQGPVLEDADVTIGVVTGCLGQRWYDCEVTGMEAHAGPTPMALRKDALQVATKIMQETVATALRYPPYGRGTNGFVQVHPNSRNVIPGRVKFSIDLRNVDDDTLNKMDADIRAFVKKTADETKLEITIEQVSYFPPCPFEQGCVGAVREGAKTLGYSVMDCVSGAGHDAIYVARLAPAGMIFVPCKDGISHNEIEDAKPEHLEAGCNVLLLAMLDRAKQA